MVKQWAAIASTILAVIAIGILSVYARIANVDMTETRLLLTHWREASVLTVWLLISLAWLEKVR